MGSSISTQGRSETTARASARRARSPAESPAPSSPTGVARPAGRPRTRSASATWASAAHRSCSSASGRPSRRLSATVPSTNPGRCGSHAMSSCEGAATPPDVGSSRPASTASRVDFPHPEGPVNAVTPRAGIVSDRSSSTGTVRPDRRTVRSVTVRGWSAGWLAGWSRRPLVAGAPRCSTTKGGFSSSLTRSTTATPSAAAWNSAPTRRSGQYASGASSSTTRAVRRSRPPSASRRPTVTATSATDRVATSSSTPEDRKATRRVSRVRRR